MTKHIGIWRWVLGIALTCNAGSVAAQHDTVEVSSKITTSLRFQSSIIHVDRGTADLSALIVPGAANVILVKASSDTMQLTNLTVVTNDGLVHVFPIRYSANPARMQIEALRSIDVPLRSYLLSVIDNEAFLAGSGTYKFGIRAKILGIYVRNDKLLFQVGLENSTAIGYNIGMLRFAVRDKKRRKRFASQEVELQLVSQCGNDERIPPFGKTTIAVAFDSFSIDDQKHLVLQLAERNGGRYLKLKISNRKILKARPLPDLSPALHTMN